MVVVHRDPDAESGAPLGTYAPATDRWTPVTTAGDPRLDVIGCSA